MARLFEPDLPEGFRYRDDFISREEEAGLIESIAEIEFSTFEMRGVVARRRVAFFGRSYDAVPGDRPRPEKPIPQFLFGVRDRLAEWAGIAPAAFAMPSRGEGFGLVYLQAMRAGVPCLGSRDDAAADVIVVR